MLSFITPTAGGIWLWNPPLLSEMNTMFKPGADSVFMKVSCSCDGALIIQAVWAFYKAEFMQSVSLKKNPTGSHVQQAVHRQSWTSLSGMVGCCKAAVIEIIFTSWWEMVSSVCSVLGGKLSQANSPLSFNSRVAALHWSSTVKLLLTEDWYIMAENRIFWTKLTYSRMSVWGLLGLCLFILEPLYLWLIKLTSDITEDICVCFFLVCVCLKWGSCICAASLVISWFLCFSQSSSTTPESPAVHRNPIRYGGPSNIPLAASLLIYSRNLLVGVKPFPLSALKTAFLFLSGNCANWQQVPG